MITSLRRLACAGRRAREDLKNAGRAGLWELAKGAGVAVFFAWFFYRSPLALAPMCPVGALYAGRNLRRLAERRRRAFLEQFQECIFSVAASLRAGYAVENAFLESIQDMQTMFGEDSAMERELRAMGRGLSNNVPLEELLRDLGERSGCGEVREFAQVFGIAKRNGGSIPEMIEVCGHVIADRRKLEEEIRVLLASKQLEQRVMSVMPFLIVLYLEAGNRGYFDGLYHNFLGAAVMTGALALYLASAALSERVFAGIFREEE